MQNWFSDICKYVFVDTPRSLVMAHEEPKNRGGKF